jgi:hypothetical protein
MRRHDYGQSSNLLVGSQSSYQGKALSGGDLAFGESSMDSSLQDSSVLALREALAYD